MQPVLFLQEFLDRQDDLLALGQKFLLVREAHSDRASAECLRVQGEVHELRRLLGHCSVLHALMLLLRRACFLVSCLLIEEHDARFVLEVCLDNGRVPLARVLVLL